MDIAQAEEKSLFLVCADMRAEKENGALTLRKERNLKLIPRLFSSVELKALTELCNIVSQMIIF